MSKLKGVKVEYHILQSFPVSCLNRDDVGAPKSAIVGGVKRGRVSSQCWKRQVRLSLHDFGISIAIRSKRIADLIVSYIENADDCDIKNAEKIANALASDTLVFISSTEIKALAEYITENKEDIQEKDSVDIKIIKTILKPVTKKSFKCLDGLDIALFGRMVANAADLSVQAASSFSHAITTHKISSEVDYFTAVDDKEGATRHIGSLEYSSGTFYRYISLDLGILEEHIGIDAIPQAVDAFTKALYLAVPQARQNTQAGYCLWDYAHVYIRKGQGMQLSFDKPVLAHGNGYLEPSIEAMKAALDKREKEMGSLFGMIDSLVFGDGSSSIDNLSEKITSSICKLMS